MSRQKGTPNRKREQLDVLSHSEADIFIPGELVELPENKTKEVLLMIVDALYEKDGNAKLWGEIRKEVEKL
ncbi:MAG: hypothetical protein PHY28_09905 [Dehalococcoidales bacterium]|jgi:hypothetical protein|nr:hypothetical protein [Dehalococcoidales bacterium]